MQSHKTIIIILILLAFGIGGVFVFSQNNDDWRNELNNVLSRKPKTIDTAPPLVKPAATTTAQTIEELAAEYGIEIVDKGELPEPTIDTSDWQTYRNEEFGFEVRYPRGLFVDVVLQPKGSIAVLFKEVPYNAKYSFVILKKLTIEPLTSIIEKYRKQETFGYKLYGDSVKDICSYYYQNSTGQWFRVYGCFDTATEIFRSLNFFK